jgi:hypothetical protein
MTPKHKHAEYIHGWAEGKTIQVWIENMGWLDDPNPGWNDWQRYRFKPTTKIVTQRLKYRRYITSGCYGQKPAVFCFQYDKRYDFNPENDKGFVKWIDNDWIFATFEEEIEI